MSSTSTTGTDIRLTGTRRQSERKAPKLRSPMGFYPQLLISLIGSAALIAALLYAVLLPLEREMYLDDFGKRLEQQLHTLSNSLVDDHGLVSAGNLSVRLKPWISTQPYLQQLVVLRAGVGRVFTWNSTERAQGLTQSTRVPILLSDRTVGEIVVDWDTYPPKANADLALQRNIGLGMGLSIALMATLLTVLHLLIMRHLITLKRVNNNADVDVSKISNSPLVAHEVADLAQVIDKAQRTWQGDQQRKEDSMRLQGYLRAIIANALDGIIVTNHERVIQSMNPTAEKILNTPEEAARGRRLDKMLRIVERIPQDNKPTKAANDDKLLPNHRMTNSSETVKVEFRKNAFRYYNLSQATFEAEGSEFGVIVLRDTTQEIEQTQHLEKAKQVSEEAAKAKTHFLAMMSHEIRTPLNGISGILQLMQNAKTTTNFDKYIQEGIHSTESLKRIIGDMLDISRIEAGKVDLEIDQFSPEAIAREELTLAKLLLNNKPVQLQIDLDEQLPPFVSGDSGKIRQVIRNMLSNAVKFTDQGIVKLSLRQMPGDKVTESKLFFSVQDTGMGIPKGKESHVFAEFDSVNMDYTRKHGGTGLGMAISKKLIEAMNGRIDFESTPGKGSHFWFCVSLPIVTDRERKQNATIRVVRSAASRDLTGIRVLLVEDNPTNTLIAKHMLEQKRCKVMTAADGVEALEMLDKFEYDAVFMDVAMPRMDGLTACKEIRERGGLMKMLPIIAMTAHVSKSDVSAAKQAGMNDYLPKPIDRETMLETLRRFTLNKREIIKPINR